MSQTLGQSVDQLHELVEQVTAANELPSDVWAGKRCKLRRTLIVPVTIRSVADNEMGPTSTHWLQNISETGLGITSHYHFEVGQLLYVELNVNNTIWGGQMTVVHSTGTISGFKIGLALKEEAAPVAKHEVKEAPTRGLPDPTRLLRRTYREQTWLDKAKADIRRATKAYYLARRTWGLLGIQVQKQIQKVVNQLPGEPTPDVQDERRKNRRRNTNAQASLVVHSTARWRQFTTRILDVSHYGLKAEIMLIEEDAVELELEGEFKFGKGMVVVVGLGADPDTLWVPAEIVRFQELGNGVVHLGLQFNTPKSVEAFEA